MSSYQANELPGLDVDAVSNWMLSSIEGLRAPINFTLIAGGRSNLTFLAKDSHGRKLVLRRPPTGHVLPSAHDMGREFKIISALHSAQIGVPVARSLGFCDDDTVTGSNFYVMDFAEGLILRTESDAMALEEPVRRRSGESLVEVMARLHNADVRAIGLDDLGRHEGYIERQLKRWLGQYEQMKTREIAAMDSTSAALADLAPEQQRVSVVHGDYRLDNTVLSPSGEVVAVLDWEICTLGDPLADLGLLMVYWPQKGETGVLGPTFATTAPGFSTRQELVDHYQNHSSLDLSNLWYYTAFGYWKLAAILQGVYFRYKHGAGAGDASGIDYLGDQVEALAQRAQEVIANRSI